MKGSMRFIWNLLFILILFAALFAYAMFQGGFTSWFLFFGFLPIFLYQLAFLFYPLRHWKLERDISAETVRAGDTVTVKVRIERRFPFPLFYCIFEEVFPEGLHKKDEQQRKYRYMAHPQKSRMVRDVKRAVFPSFRRRFEFSYELKDLPRGVHDLNGVKVRTADLFGLVRKEYLFPVKDQLNVYPAEVPIQLADKWSSLGEGSAASSRTWNHSNIATGAREYAPGDKVAWIDWKQTARRNEIMTKEFEQEKGTDILLVLNSCWHQGMNMLAYEAAVEVAASLLAFIRRESAQAGLLIVGEESICFPVHEEEQASRAAQQLAKIQPSRSGPFVWKLKEEIFRLKEENVILFITTQLDEGWIQTIQPMKARSKQVVILFVQASAWVSERERNLANQMKMEGVEVIAVTEDHLLQSPVKVEGV
ncbi:DUF58 domain-containing protein [Virgibacillus sediminis]|uniref:DUF58 domain-containing protein n=1 Tax=Virgibacillus sediminis TaxID=202260 RepID=A0ABV7A8V2_9BACI